MCIYIYIYVERVQAQRDGYHGLVFPVLMPIHAQQYVAFVFVPANYVYTDIFAMVTDSVTCLVMHIRHMACVHVVTYM